MPWTGAPLNTPHRLSTADSTTLPKGSDYAGECTERIRATLGLGAVRHLTRYHRPRSAALPLGRLYAWIIQKPQQTAKVMLVLKPPVVTIRHRAVSERSQRSFVSLPTIDRHLPRIDSRS